MFMPYRHLFKSVLVKIIPHLITPIINLLLRNKEQIYLQGIQYCLIQYIQLDFIIIMHHIQDTKFLVSVCFPVHVSQC